MGPTRMRLSKPVIAAIAGHAVAGGLELALWCDLRVAEQDAVLGVFCRRWGVPLIDGGTVRLPRLIGASRAMDLILTGRPVDAAEALAIGLVNRVVGPGESLAAAQELARTLAALPADVHARGPAVSARAGGARRDAMRWRSSSTTGCGRSPRSSPGWSSSGPAPAATARLTSVGWPAQRYKRRETEQPGLDQ